MPFIHATDGPLHYAAIDGLTTLETGVADMGTIVVSWCDLPCAPTMAATGYGAWNPALSEVLVVSSLEDKGPGTLRAALERRGNRLVVFNVAGTITLVSSIEAGAGDIWIDGANAPAGGVCIRGGTLSFSRGRVALYHLRLRLGITSTPGSGDCVRFGESVTHAVMDHCSLSWSTDELAALRCQSATLSNCILGQALSNAGHPDGEHSKACFCYKTQAVSIINTLFIDNVDRNPIITNGYLQLINCVSFNCSWHYISPEDGPIFADIIGNVFIAGPDTQPGYTPKHAIRVKPTWPAFVDTRLYLEDNALDGYLLIRANESTGEVIEPLTPPHALMASALTLDYVLAHAGATLPRRDSADTYMINEIANREGAIIDTPDEVGGWPDLTI